MLRKIKLILFLLIFISTKFINAQRYVMVSTSEPDTKIFVDGQHLGTGSLKVKISYDNCVNVTLGLKNQDFLRVVKTIVLNQK